MWTFIEASFMLAKNCNRHICSWTGQWINETKHIHTKVLFAIKRTRHWYMLRCGWAWQTCEVRMPDTKGHLWFHLCEMYRIDTGQRHKVLSGYLGLLVVRGGKEEMEVTAWRAHGFFGWGNVLKLKVVMVVHIYEDSKTHWTVHLKCTNAMVSKILIRML
jgi:hypothetical protein